MQLKKSVLLASVLSVALLPSFAGAAEILTGTFTSGFQDGPKSVRAIFTPTDAGKFKVTFLFKFNGKDHAYVGSATGTLGEGELQGKVVSDGNRRRTFTFKGEFNDKGVFTGKHAETTKGRPNSTGTISLEG